MKKRTYRSKKINQINWNDVKETLSGGEVALAIDVAKQNQYALLFTNDYAVSELFRWEHPQETPMMLAAIDSLSCSVVVIVESTCNGQVIL